MDIAGTNLMIDHVSTLYATDETISMNEVANNITVQYSNISQGQNYPQWDAEGGGLTGHALGSLLEAGNDRSGRDQLPPQSLRAPEGARAADAGGRQPAAITIFATTSSTTGSAPRAARAGRHSSISSTTSTWPATAAINPVGGTNPGHRRRKAAARA